MLVMLYKKLTRFDGGSKKYWYSYWTMDVGVLDDISLIPRLVVVKMNDLRPDLFVSEFPYDVSNLCINPAHAQNTAQCFNSKVLRTN